MSENVILPTAVAQGTYLKYTAAESVYLKKKSNAYVGNYVEICRCHCENIPRDMASKNKEFGRIANINHISPSPIKIKGFYVS